MRYKRVTLIAGHYGSGKTNIAVNMALDLAKQKDNVAIADLDIINPYYRTLDSRAELEAAGVRLIVSPFANSNLDIPALPQEMYAVVDDLSLNCIIDVGGDDTGAVALGRLAPKLREEDDYDMYLIEHQKMYEAIRGGNVINNGDYMAKATMMGIAARMACYTGARLSWADALASEESMAPTGYTWDDSPWSLPDDKGRYLISVPGEGRVYHQIVRD